MTNKNPTHFSPNSTHGLRYESNPLYSDSSSPEYESPTYEEVT